MIVALSPWQMRWCNSVETLGAPDDLAPTLHLVVEPTGGYELPLVAFAYEQGWAVSLPNPRQVRDWAKGMGQRAKHDRQSARLLARYGATCRPQPQIPALATEVSELDSLLKRRQDLQDLLQQEKNRQQEWAGRPGVRGR